ncbi:MAG: NAD(P)H-dependent oxidoreductase [Rhodococcus sp. (in: high G+C Gram-positive bacteria)]
MTSATATIVGIVASESIGGKTTTAVRSVLDAVSDRAQTSLLELRATDEQSAFAALAAADAVVFGSPVYRAGHSSLLKSFLEKTQRGLYGETDAPLQGKAAAIVLTGADAHHYLAGDELRAVLSGFFAVQVLAPSLYFHGGDWEAGALTSSGARIAHSAGNALVDLAFAVKGSSHLQGMQPLV